MRVLFFGDSPQRIGGAQKSLLAALEHIERFGVEPTLVFPAAGPFEALCRTRGLRVELVDAGPAFRTYEKKLLGLTGVELARVLAGDVLRTCRDLARLADRSGASAFHFNTPRGIVMAGGAAQLARLPSVLHLRGWPELPQRIWLTAQALADAYVLVARRLLGALETSAARRATVVYNGIVPEPRVSRAAARAAAAAWLAERGHTVDVADRWVLSLSAPVPFKGLHHLLEAAAQLARGGRHEVTWLLAGEGLGDAYEAWLRRRVTELGLDAKVRFIGHVDDPMRWLCAADLLVLSSVSGETLRYDGREVRAGGEEGLPRSILESLAAGTPVVTTSGGGVREEIDDGVTGLIIPPSDPPALAEAVERVLSDPSWQDRALELGPRRVAERFSIEGAARGLADVLRSASRPGLFLRRAENVLRLALDAARRVKRS